MGIDVVFKARPHERMDATTFEALRYLLHVEFPDELAGVGWRFPDMAWDVYEDAPTIEVSSADRYYGVDYERGHWPQIEALGDWLAEAFDGVAELRYGGDHADDWCYLVPWATARAELRPHWDRVGNEPYRAKR